MKKFFKLLMIPVLLISVIALTGCENKEEVEDPNGLHILLLDTEGMGQVSYYIDEGNNSDFNDEKPVNMVSTTFLGTATVKLDAKADPGYEFVHWIRDEKEYLNDQKVEVTISKNTKIIAVFKIKE